MNRILSLDLGTKTGWASQNSLGVISSGVQSFSGSRFDGGGMRYLRFSRWLDELIDPVDEVYFEEVRRHIGVDAAHAYGGFLATLTSTCEKKGIPYCGVPVGTIKKFITGKGNSGKPQVIQSVKDLGFNPKDDNEADAISLLLYSISEFAKC